MAQGSGEPDVIQCSNCTAPMETAFDEVTFTIHVEAPSQVYEIGCKVPICGKCPDAAMIRAIEHVREFVKKMEK